MYCLNCGKELPDSSSFCLQCGRDQRLNQSTAFHKPSVSSKGAGISVSVVMMVLGCALIVGIIVVAYLRNESANRDAAVRQRTATIAQSEPVTQPQTYQLRQPERVTIVDKTFPVAAQKYVYYTIPLKADLNHLTGHFTAQGGSNDIEVLVLDQDEFTNFSNGHNAKTFYNSGGYITTGSIDLRLPSGTYYVVFNNARAMLTNKVITAKIEAE